MTNQAVILIVMAGYMLMIIVIGILFARRSNKNAESYFLGGRTLGPWVSAMSAEASDMSGYLLMGVPGLAYWCGLADAGWTAIGLALGTYLNWLLVSRRLRSYSVAAGNAITVPDFLSNRFHEKKKVILGVSAIFILIFFTVYAASCFVTCGKLFAGLFNMSYHSMMLGGAAFVLLYTMLGGFLAESVSDFIQAMVMVAALLCVLIAGLIVKSSGLYGAIRDRYEVQKPGEGWERWNTETPGTRIPIGDDIVRIDAVSCSTQRAEVQLTGFDRIPGGVVYARLLHTLRLENERGEVIDEWEDCDYPSCVSSSGTLYVCIASHRVNIEPDDTYIRLIYDRLGEHVALEIPLPGREAQPCQRSASASWAALSIRSITAIWSQPPKCPGCTTSTR